MVIRKATRGDASGILECLRLAFDPYRGRYTPEAFADTVMNAQTIQHRLSMMTVLVAVDDSNTILGTVGCQRVGPDEGHLRGMAVRPAQIGSGLAGRLLEAVEDELRRQGCSRITLDTTAPLERAVRFYERHGFRRTGVVRDFFGMPLFEFTKEIVAQGDLL